MWASHKSLSCAGHSDLEFLKGVKQWCIVKLWLLRWQWNWGASALLKITRPIWIHRRSRQADLVRGALPARYLAPRVGWKEKLSRRNHSKVGLNPFLPLFFGRVCTIKKSYFHMILLQFSDFFVTLVPFVADPFHSFNLIPQLGEFQQHLQFLVPPFQTLSA